MTNESLMQSFDGKILTFVIRFKYCDEVNKVTGRANFLHKNGRIGFMVGGTHVSLNEDSIQYSGENALGHFFYDQFAEIQFKEARPRVGEGC